METGINVQEIIRCTALAMRRRRKLMGPACARSTDERSDHDLLAPPRSSQSLDRVLDRPAIGDRLLLRR